MTNNNLIKVHTVNEIKRGVVMVALPSVEDKYKQSPLGHASLMATLLKENALDVREEIYAVSDENTSVDELVKFVFRKISSLKNIEIDVAIGVYIWNDTHVKKLLGLLRQQGFKGRIILGGPQITYAGQGLELYYPEADVFIRGYAELALLQVVSSVDKTTISGVHYAREIDLGGQAKVDIETIPSPWLNGTNNVNAIDGVRWETQRGCNFNCSFCQHRQADSKAKPAMLDKTRVAQEIALFCKAGVPGINVLDPVFNMDKTHSLWVLNQFREHGYKGKISLQCRAEMINEEFLEAAKSLDVCLEFGLQSIVKEEYKAVRRDNNLKKIEECLIEVQRHDIKHEVSIIYGLPNQTLDSFKETVSWCLGMKIPVIKAFPLLLLRGTKLEKERGEWLFEVNENGFPSVISSNTFTQSDFLAMEKISDALAMTEGHHPINLKELEEIYSNFSSNVKTPQQRALGK